MGPLVACCQEIGLLTVLLLIIYVEKGQKGISSVTF